ncbi:hypothetical protein CRUP_018237, partial [Coryphaenoides rupestris]
MDRGACGRVLRGAPEECRMAVGATEAADRQDEHASEDSERGLDKPPVLRHYEAGVRSYRKNRRAVDHTGHPPAAPLVEGMPRIPQVKREDPSKRKLHYGTSDGSSVVYPSGRVAVCQSGSGLPCRGFYTNVFSDADGEGAAVIASITAFGHGAVTHPH